MSEILTQEEVDNLLAGLSSGKIETESHAGGDSDGVVLYDFISQERVIRGRMPTFEVINERMAREMRESLSALLHNALDVSVARIDTLKFSEFVRSLPVPTSMHVFRMDPLRGYALLVLESQLVYNLIDIFFGGKAGGKARIEGKEFTHIEGVMIRKVVIAFLKGIETAWVSVEQIKTAFIRSEVNPQFAAIVPPNDLVIAVKFEIELEQSAGSVTLCIPYAMIEPLRSKLVAGFQSDRLDADHTWQKRMKEVVLESVVNVSVQLGGTEITGDRLIHLKIGDIIQLDNDAEKSLLGFVEDVPKMRGFAGVNRGAQAFRVDQKLSLE